MISSVDSTTSMKDDSKVQTNVNFLSDDGHIIIWDYSQNDLNQKKRSVLSVLLNVSVFWQLYISRAFLGIEMAWIVMES